VKLLRSLTDLDPSLEVPEALRPGVDGVHEILAESVSWPIDISPFHESPKNRERRINLLKIGRDSPIKKSDGRGGAKRHYGSQAGFALDIFGELESIRKNASRHLHPADVHQELNEPGVLLEEQKKRSWKNLAALLTPFEKDTLEEWAAVSLEYCRDICGGNWEAFPWPSFILEKAGKDPSGDGSLRTTESAIRGKIKDGLKSLI
jgi:hypothetical protein